MKLKTIKPIFCSANLGVALGIIIHVVTFNAPFATLYSEDVYQGLSVSSKMALALLPNVGMWFGLKVIVSKESSGDGLQWSHVASPVSEYDDLTMLHVWLMLIIDIFLYLIFIWYLDNVKPGKYGVARKWYFFLQVSVIIIYTIDIQQV